MLYTVQRMSAENINKLLFTRWRNFISTFRSPCSASVQLSCRWLLNDSNYQRRLGLYAGPSIAVLCTPVCLLVCLSNFNAIAARIGHIRLPSNSPASGSKFRSGLLLRANILLCCNHVSVSLYVTRVTTKPLHRITITSYDTIMKYLFNLLHYSIK